MNLKKRDLKENKKAQIQMGFGVIFSIILIVVFIAFAIYGISKFLEIDRIAKMAKFESDLQDEINSAFRSDSISKPFEYHLPKKITQVCFEDKEYENMYYLPREYGGVLLKNIDILRTVTGPGSLNRRLCIDVKNGRFFVNIKKDRNENLVKLLK